MVLPSIRSGVSHGDGNLHEWVLRVQNIPASAGDPELSQAEKGERRVSELLSQLRRYRYVAFDDLVKGDCNIDHVVVGPGGVSAIETKAYTIFGNGRIGISSEGFLRISNKPAHGNPSNQAKGAAKIVSQELQRCLRREIPVQPVLVFPGWSVDVPKKDLGLVVLNDGLIPEFFASRQRMLSDAEISQICSHLDLIARS